MVGTIRGLALIALMPAISFGQAAADRAEFEVASIKPAPPQAPGRTSTRLSIDQDRVIFTNASLRDVLRQAYGVQDSQIVGPDWLGSDRFDFAAKLPSGAPTDQVPRMFQALLADRFKLALHHETKELPLYILTTAKGGPKLQKAESATGISAQSTAVRYHVNAKLTMDRFAEYISSRVGRPVKNTTNLKGVFDMTLDWAPDTAEAAAASDPLPSIFTAVQEQLGLKLESAKAPIDVLVIDHAEKVPTEN